MKLTKEQVNMKLTEKLKKKKILEIGHSVLANEREGQPGVSEWYSQGMTKA